MYNFHLIQVNKSVYLHDLDYRTRLSLASHKIFILAQIITLDKQRKHHCLHVAP